VEKVEQGFNLILVKYLSVWRSKLRGIFSRGGAAEHLYLLDAARDVLLDRQQEPLYEAMWRE
jgi:hypothetical protein